MEQSMVADAPWWSALLPSLAPERPADARRLELRAAEIPAEITVWLPDGVLEAAELEPGRWVVAWVRADGTRDVVASHTTVTAAVAGIGQHAELESERIPVAPYPAYGVPVAIVQCPHGELVVVKSGLSEYQGWFHAVGSDDRRELRATRWSLTSLLRWATGPKGPGTPGD